MSAPDANQPVGAGTVLCGRYRLVQLVASGGMASVWEAQDNVLARAVAVKMLHPHLAGDRAFLERFRQEAVSAARLAHPNVVATYDAGVAADGTAFIVMELIRGRTLSTFAADHRPLPIFVCVEIGMQIAEALAQAHSAGLVHRDIKPANVLVCDTESDGVPLVKVTDFGIAKATEGLTLDLTKTGMVLGTPKYLSPEQIEGRDPDARADLYALGVVLFELVTGAPPFRGPTEMAVAVQHLNEMPPRLRDLRPIAPPALESLVASMLAKRPGDRPPTAFAVRQALSAIGGMRDPSPSMGPGRPLSPPAEPDNGRSPRGALPGSPRPPGPRTPTPQPSPGSGPGSGPGAGPGSGPGAGPTPAPFARTSVVPPPPGYPGALPPPPRPGSTGTSPTARPAARRPAGPPSPVTSAPGSRARPRPQKRPNWTGRLVALLVVAALIVVVLVLAHQGSGSGNGSSSDTTVATVPIRFAGDSVFHLERDADHEATVGYAIDNDMNTSWQTDVYHGPHFANLRNGLGLALTLATPAVLHTLTVSSSTQGWSAEVYVADAVPSPAALAPWGAPVDSKQGIDGSTTFDLRGQRGGAVLLWITDPGPTFQASVAEVTAR